MKRLIVKGLILLSGMALLVTSILVLQPVIGWWNVLVSIGIGFSTGWLFSMADNID